MASLRNLHAGPDIQHGMGVPDTEAVHERLHAAVPGSGRAGQSPRGMVNHTSHPSLRRTGGTVHVGSFFEHALTQHLSRFRLAGDRRRKKEEMERLQEEGNRKHKEWWGLDEDGYLRGKAAEREAERLFKEAGRD